MDELTRFVASESSRFTEELFDFLRIPSISARTEHEPDMTSAARWLAESMDSAGLDASIHATGRHPIVLGENREAGPHAPTLLVYGHYDVQPPDPLNLWSSPPFEPEIRDGRLYARGSSDDKGQLFLHLKAFETLRSVEGSLPVNVVFLAEGEEEIGSPSLVPFVHQHRERLECDAVVISDTEMFAPGIPAILFSLRGLAYFELRIRGAKSDLHSGSYGGSVANPANALSRILASLVDDRGRVAVPGFYDRVVEWDAETRTTLAELPFDEDGYRKELGVDALSGEEGYSTLERLWMRPSCDVNGILSGYTGEGAKTVLPGEAMGKVSFRLVGDQDPERIGELFREHVRSVQPAGVEVEVETLHGGRPWKADADGPVFDAARSALSEVYGSDPVLIGAGGSIPIVVEFEEILDAPCLLMGFSLPGANLHAPDEWFPMENFESGIETLCRFYEEMGEIRL